MGKKKGNKTETNGEVDIDEIEDESPESAPAAVKKGKKSKKKKDDYDDEDIAKELEELRLEESGEKKEVEEKDEVPAPEKKNKKDKKKSKKKAASSDEESDEETAPIKPKMGGGFAALMMDDEDDDDDDEMDEDSEEEVVVAVKSKPKKDKKKKENKSDEVGDTATPPPAAAPAEEEKGGKKGKKGKKKKKDQDEDEDIDALLAEIEAEHRGEKPKPKDEPKEDKNDDSEKKPEDIPPPAEEESKKKKKKKKGQSEAISEPASTDTKKESPTQEEEDEEKAGDDVTEETSSKKKKKKKKGKDTAAAESKEGTPAPEAKEGTPDNNEGDDDNDDESSGKKKKKKGEKEEKKKKGAPGNKMLLAMKEELARQEAERERLRMEEEAEERKEDERIKSAEEAKKLEEERRERKKLKEKERKERLRAEGKLLTKAQKQAQQRAQEMLEHLRAQGVELPEVGDKRPRAGTRVRPGKKNRKDQSREETPEEKSEVVEKMEVETAIKVEEVKAEEEEDEVKDAWDVSSEEEVEEEEKPEVKKDLKGGKKQEAEDDDDEDDDDDDDEDEDESEEESSEEDSSDDDMTEAERKRAKAEARIEKRKADNEKNRDPDVLRAPVVCVLGHVDHGKTKILDKLRRTNVQDGEVGGITQQIGATNVPMDAITGQTRHVKDFNIKELQFPGLLIIDTPGHESFRNLRTRGSSMCDIAILVVDITQGLEPQTIESINLLKKRKTPFLIALNKIDRVFEWESYPTKDVRETITAQNESSRNDFTRRTSEIILALNEQGLNAALFWENPDERQYVSLVPTSAISGDGMGNLIAMIAQMCQKRLSQRLMFTEQLQCIVLEVKTIVGHGVTIDVILINGRLRTGDTIVLAGMDGPIVTQIRSLLLPQPMKEIRVKGQYSEFKEVKAATGLKIAAKEFEKAIAGLELLVAQHEDEVEIYREIADKDLKAAMRSMKCKDLGVYVQASTLGALEALLEFFKTNKVPYSGVRVGPVVKRDVMKAAAMLEHDPMYAAILAFDVKVERDAQELADKEGVKIFSEETIYHLGDRYVDYIKEFKKKKQDEFKMVAVFPSRIKIIPTAIFNKRDPIVLGVTVEHGILRVGTPLCVPTKEFVEIGIVTSLEYDHKPVDLAKKGVDVCIKIEPMPGHTPKLFGRHFDETDMLVSKISRESINACKDYFRDDLGKGEWKLMAELKKEFQIL